MLLQRTKLVLSSLVLSSALACNSEKATDETSVKSLDNLAAGKTVSVNACKGAYNDAALATRWASRINVDPALNGKIDAAKLASYKALVSEYVTALHPDMQKLYLDMGGQVTLTPKGNQICGGLVSDQSNPNYVEDARRSMESCYLFVRNEAEGGKNQTVLTIIHHVSAEDAAAGDDKNAQRIKHGGVRAAQLAFVQLISRMTKNDNASEVAQGLKLKYVGTDSTLVAGLKRQVANSFLIDVARANGLDNLESLLGAGSAAALKSEIFDAAGKMKSGLSAVDLVEKLTFKRSASESLSASGRATRIKQVEDAVASEALDSATCSTETQRVLASSFSTTKPYAEQLAAALAAHAKSIEVSEGGNFGLQEFAGDGMTFTSAGSPCANCGCPCCNGNCSGGGCPCCQGGCPCCPNKPQQQNQPAKLPAFAGPAAGSGAMAQTLNPAALMPFLKLLGLG